MNDIKKITIKYFNPYKACMRYVFLMGEKSTLPTAVTHYPLIAHYCLRRRNDREIYFVVDINMHFVSHQFSI